MTMKKKKTFYKKWWVWLLAIIVISVVFSGDEETAENTSSGATKSETKAKEETKVFGMGEEVKVEKLAYTLNSVEEKKEITREYLEDITTSGKFVIVEVKIKNLDKEARFIDSEMFRLVSADETEYSSNTEADMYINDGDLGFFLKEINPNMDMTGKVAFEVPGDADLSKLQLQVSSGFGWSGGEYQVINLK